jgi:hypothetical protein
LEIEDDYNPFDINQNVVISELSEEKKITETDFDFLEINNPNR